MDTDILEGQVGFIALVVVVVAPTFEIAVGVDCTDVDRTDGHIGVSASGWRKRNHAVAVITPTIEVTGCIERTGCAVVTHADLGPNHIEPIAILVNPIGANFLGLRVDRVIRVVAVGVVHHIG
jgi:hypothetical protein